MTAKPKAPVKEKTYTKKEVQKVIKELKEAHWEHIEELEKEIRDLKNRLVTSNYADGC